MIRACGSESDTPCHLDCATGEEWNAATIQWRKSKEEEEA